MSWVVALKPFGPLHWYRYGAVPPLTVRSTLPVAVFGHNGLLGVSTKLIGVGWLTLIIAVDWHPPLSVTTNV